MAGSSDSPDPPARQDAAAPARPSSLDTLTRGDVIEALERGLASCGAITTMLAALAEAGCGVGRDFFHVVRCDAAVGGGYAQEDGIVLCHNRLHTRQEVLNAVTHELIHAFDDCRRGGAAGQGRMDWSNCSHHACTEIRAANLSGDCSRWQELMRGNLPLLPHHWPAQQHACVARRAALSVAMNPACAGPQHAAQVVAEMMPACLADTVPLGHEHAAVAPPAPPPPPPPATPAAAASAAQAQAAAPQGPGHGAVPAPS